MAEDRRKYNKGRAPGSKNKIQGELKDKTPTPNSRQATFRDESTLATNDFLKVRPGESQEQWEKRTIKKRVHSQSDQFPIKIAKNGRLVISKRRAKGKSKEMRLKILVRYHERPFDFLKMYAFVMRWASVKFKVVKDDIELGYYFYEGTPFTKQEFDLVCTQLGAVRGVFSRFVKKGYVTNISLQADNGVIKETEYFQLSTTFNHILSKVYGAISRTAPASTNEYWSQGKLSPELKMVIDNMNDEINEILANEIKN